MVPHLTHLPHFVMNTLQTFMGLAVFVLLLRTRQLKTYWPLLGMSVWQAPAYFVLLYVRAQGHAHISPMRAYHMYFDVFWPSLAVSLFCSLVFPYVLFRTAMRPLKGLRSLGNIVFGWVALISVLTTLSVAYAPAPTGVDPLVLALSQLERASALITVSLVAFVAMAIRPMGLSVHSRIFGTSIGTLVVAATNAAQASFYKDQQHILFYSTYALLQMCSSCVALAIWVYYFAKPEPQRKFILLPTTSPFHVWNEVAKTLGHEPAVVAIGGVNPDSLSPAEVEVMLRLSPKKDQLKEQHDREVPGALPG